jgi:hypothetical protein
VDCNSRTQERVDKYGASGILGVAPRTVVTMATKGELSGAAKIGRAWTFDAAKLRDYVRRKEIEACRRNEMPLPAAIGAMGSSGAVRRSKVSSDGGLYTQTIQKLRVSAGKLERTNSRLSHTMETHVSLSLK